MSSLYELNFEPTKYYQDTLIQHQIGVNFYIDSYLMMNSKYFYDYEDFDDFIENYNPTIYFKDVEYNEDGPNGNLYRQYYEDIYNHTIKLERFVPRSEGFEFTIPLIKNGYNINGKHSVNLVALFGYNYYTDEERIEREIKCLGYLHFVNDYIPLYNTRDYGMQINAVLKYSMGVIDGYLEPYDSQPFKMVRKYYNGEELKGINILNNIIIE